MRQNLVECRRIGNAKPTQPKRRCLPPHYVDVLLIEVNSIYMDVYVYMCENKVNIAA